MNTSVSISSCSSRRSLSSLSRKRQRPQPIHHCNTKQTQLFSTLLLITVAAALSFHRQCDADSTIAPIRTSKRKPAIAPLDRILFSNSRDEVKYRLIPIIWPRGGHSDSQDQNQKQCQHPTSRSASLLSYRLNPSLPPSSASLPSLRGLNRTFSLGFLNNTTEEFQRRKKEWVDRYTTLEGLRGAFGTNKNKLWGDLDAAASRRLYKTLLPNALCELVLELGVRPEEMAPLAYEARKAAKLYARERCHLPARIAANLFDGYRQWKRYGRFQMSGMSYDQIWDKYRSMILDQVVIDGGTVVNRTVENLKSSGNSMRFSNCSLGPNQFEEDDDDEWTERDIVIETCLKILDRSCTTNERIDRMVLLRSTQNDQRGKNGVDRKLSALNSTCSASPSEISAREHLIQVAKTLEYDVRKLLDPSVLGYTEELARPHNRNGRLLRWMPLSRSGGEVLTTSEPRMTDRQYQALVHFALSRRRKLSLDAMEGGAMIPPRIWNSTSLQLSTI